MRTPIARPRAALLLASLAVALGGCATTPGNSLDRAVRCEAGEFTACDRYRGEPYPPYGRPYDLWDAYGGSMGEFGFWYGMPYPNDGFYGDWRHRYPYRNDPRVGRYPRIDRRPDAGWDRDGRRWHGRPPPHFSAPSAPPQGAPPQAFPPQVAPPQVARPPVAAPSAAPRERVPAPPPTLRRDPELRTQQQ